MNEHLVFGTRFGNIEELIPESYYVADGSRADTDVEFKKINDEIYGFSVNKSIPENEMLIIDPTQIRLWATYYGGTNNEYGGFPATDRTGNVFLAGVPPQQIILHQQDLFRILLQVTQIFS